ncbi:HEPN domain-containing protein [Rhodoferax sp.]|uniref:ApeA N-terminal domain 1-containing protein n=1 Tax=Rhodoferax sp. TaxID=50421 RepID=UPI00374C9579
MRHTIDSDHHTTLRVKLSHAQIGDIGEGTLTFGYGCLASVALDGFRLTIELDDNQLAAGLLAIAADGRKLSLFNCTMADHAIYPEFVVEGEVRDLQFNSFEVRYSEVSEWFFQQMQVGSKLGEEIKWHAVPAPIVANVAMPSDNFRIESFYVGSLEQSGEDRTLHQHFEFRFTATKNRFSPVEIKKLVLQFANLLSILLAHQCPIVSIDVSPEGHNYGRMYYGISNSPPKGARQDERDRITWHKFLAQKSDIDDCWEEVVNAFFRSKYREVIWSRLAGMQNHKGFWEYHVLGYVTLLDGYVSQRFSGESSPKIPPKKKLRLLEAALAKVQPQLDSIQHAAVMSAASEIFSASGSFASKFKALLNSLDPDVVKIINLTQDDFDLIKELRDEVAHGQQLTFKAPDLTPIFQITNRIILLFTYLFFLDVALEGNIFLRCLSRSHTELRMTSKLDEVHLDRTLYPERFFPVSSQELLAIHQRSRRLHCACFERDIAGVVTYSEGRSLELAGKSGPFHELLGLPKDAVSYLSLAYFEDGAQTASIDSVLIVDLARVSI